MRPGATRKGSGPAIATASGTADVDGDRGPQIAVDVQRDQHRRQRPRLAAPEISLANTTAGDNTIDFSGTVFETPQTITLTGGTLELKNTTGVETITGPAAGVTISGGGLGRVFQIDAQVTAAISGLTITGGNVDGPGAGVANYDGTLTLTKCTVSGNSAAYGGGGLYTTDYGTTTLTDSIVSGNSAVNGGGLYSSNYGSTLLTNCTVSGNSASMVAGCLTRLPQPR